MIELDPAAAELDEGPRFPICRRDGLTDALAAAGLSGVAGTSLEIPTAFTDFDEMWQPFLGGQGPGPAYVVALDEDRRAALRATLQARVPVASDGSIHLTARLGSARHRLIAPRAHNGHRTPSRWPACAAGARA